MTYGNDIAGPVQVDGPAVGLVLQVVLLAGLTVTAGLQAIGWIIGTAFAVVTWVLLSEGLRRCGRAGLGPANLVTLARAVLVGGVTALTVESFARPVPAAVVVWLAATALLLDALDGQVARRTGTSSALGARFDMEVDAFLILVLSAFLVAAVGPWVLVIGLMRYAFLAAGRGWPWLGAALPPRFGRKLVAAVQGVALVVAAAEVLPQVLTAASLGTALALLCWSFGRDVIWLWRRRCAVPATQPSVIMHVSAARADRSRRRRGFVR